MIGSVHDYEEDKYFAENSDNDLLDFLHKDPELIIEPFLQGKHMWSSFEDKNEVLDILPPLHILFESGFKWFWKSIQTLSK